MTGTVIVSAPRAVTSAAFYDPRKMQREMFYDWPCTREMYARAAWIVPEKSPRRSNKEGPPRASPTGA